jgi:hypothetical protein
MPSATYTRIWRAIRKREPLSFFYERKYREAQPIILGYSAKGREVMMAYQTAGETSPNRKLPGWRCFDLADVRAIKSRNGNWLEGGSHKQDQTCVRFVDVDVNIPDTLVRKAPLRFGSPELRPPRRQNASSGPA